jgi:hypothetical protein
MVTSVKFSSEMWTHWLAHYTNASLGFDLVPKANFIIILHSAQARMHTHHRTRTTAHRRTLLDI